MGGVLDTAPRGGLRENFGGKKYPLVLDLGAFERFEKAHRGILAVRKDFFSPSGSPSTREILDLIILGLIGGGLDEDEAKNLAEKNMPEGLLRHSVVAMALIGVALSPEAFDEEPDDVADDEEGTSPEKS